jgi:hypothetical protein
VLLGIVNPRQLSIGILCAATVCFVGWSLLMSRKGEERPPADYAVTQEESDAKWSGIRTLVQVIEGVFR